MDLNDRELVLAGQKFSFLPIRRLSKYLRYRSSVGASSLNPTYSSSGQKGSTMIGNRDYKDWLRERDMETDGMEKRGKEHERSIIYDYTCEGGLQSNGGGSVL